jgi:serine phosphatase RsbU (regulator of sigma subunit)
MSLRLRLIAVFFLMSVVPLGGLTFYTFMGNLAAARGAAEGEAQLLASELSQRMETVTDQLSQRMSQLIESAPAIADGSATDGQTTTDALSELSMLVNKIEVRGGRGRQGPGGGRGDGEGGEDASADLNRIRIDLDPVRREIIRTIIPGRRVDELAPDERERLLAEVNQRMRDIQQGIQIVRDSVAEQVARARTAATSEAPVSSTTPSVITQPTQRRAGLTGSRFDVREERDGEVVSQVTGEIDLPILLNAVFSATRYDRSEVPFAVAKDGQLFTLGDEDRRRLEALDTDAVSAGTPPGTAVLPEWIVVTSPDPTGSGLKFGIARPMGEALEGLRRTTLRNAAIGLGFVGLALIAILPLSSRLTRNLSHLNDAVRSIAQGDYAARVVVRSDDEVGRLGRAFNQMAEDVERHQRSLIEQERLRRELELGRQIQHDMLPRVPLTLGLMDVRGISVPAREVGGDFFNYFRLADGSVALLVGDVSGKGVGSALLMANMQASLRTRLSLGQDLAALAAELDRDVESSTSGRVYATLFVGIFDPVSRQLRWVNAGHNPQLVVRKNGGLERLESTGCPIGLLPGGTYVERRAQLNAGDLLFFYTDGCVDAENAAGDMFGLERLEALLATSAGCTGDQLLECAEAAVGRFRGGHEPSDDATMMVVRAG